jgi:beta-aspartyl-peptidase (threonine type)
MWTVLTHGGAGSNPDHQDGAERAAEEAVNRLRKGASALEAVCAAVIVLEDDERFNAGTGSCIREDGKTIEMDASCMSDDGAFGAVSCIQSVKNPILVARLVMDTPHILLTGNGANRLAAKHGIAPYDPTTLTAKEKFVKRMGGVTDTVGAVVSDGKRFAAALSTGGKTGAMIGRVGDVPLPGCGLFAGEHGAIAATGDGEEIARRVLAHQIYYRLAAGEDPQRIVDDILKRFPESSDLGLLVVGRNGHGGGANRRMAWAAMMA